MAMELTHVRFALDLQVRLNVRDKAMYLLGSIYPDSRYLTGLPRGATHGTNSPRDPFHEDEDFRKGWATHVLYDGMTAELVMAQTPFSRRELVQGNEAWQEMSAVKLVEDMQSYEVLGERGRVITTLEFRKAPQDESMEKLLAYTRLQEILYREQPTLETYKKFWIEFGVRENLAESIVERAEKYLNDSIAATSIAAIYNQTLKACREKRPSQSNTPARGRV